MNTAHFPIQKHARVATLGENNVEIEKIWFVLHGYGYLAPYFVRKFEPIDDGKTLVVAPEGLHRFYQNGLSGRVGASWMTKEDRLTDIADNNHYLESLWTHYRNRYTEAKKGFIGFSQGAATMVRWFCQTNQLPDRVVIWSGSFPQDLDWFEDIPTLNQRPPTFVLGDNDEFFNEDQIKQQSNWLKSKNLNFETLRFQGGHDILPNPLQKIHQSL